MALLRLLPPVLATMLMLISLLRRYPRGGWMEEGQPRRARRARPEPAGATQARRCRCQEARLRGLGDCECGLGMRGMACLRAASRAG